MLLKNAGVSAATGRGKPITPAHKVVQNLPASRSCREPWMWETKKNATSALIQLRAKPYGIKNMPYTKSEDFCPQTLSLAGFLNPTRPHFRNCGAKSPGTPGKRAAPAVNIQQNANSDTSWSATGRWL